MAGARVRTVAWALRAQGGVVCWFGWPLGKVVCATTGALWPLWMELGAPAGVVILLLCFNQGQGLVSVAPLSNGKFKHVQVRYESVSALQ
jgi:hypothetical protein